MRKHIPLLLILFLIGIGIYLQFIAVPKERHIHAGFIVFENGKKKNFSGIDFMSLKPCHNDNEKYSREEIQDQKAHLHDNIGYVAHSHREDALWKNLFENMGYDIKNKEISGYINGKKIGNILEYPIHAYDSAVFFIGNENTSFLKEAVTKEQIIIVEKTSRDCGSDIH